MYSAPQNAVPMTNPIMMGGHGFPVNNPMGPGWGQTPQPRQSDESSDDEAQARAAKRMRFAKKDLQIQIPDSKKVCFDWPYKPSYYRISGKRFVEWNYIYSFTSFAFV